jgi:hypothetical protein
MAAAVGQLADGVRPLMNCHIMPRGLILILAFTLTANCAEAAGYNRLGAGTASCGIWTAFRREGPTSARALSSEQWVLGFLDGDY